MAKTHSSRPPAPATLGLWDTVSLIVGIIVGVGIFETPGEVFRSVDGPWGVLGAWALGGALSLVGALCFAELASAYPRSGGEYVYLTRAYGSAVGFLFAWAQLAVIRTGAGIAALAYIIANHAGQIIDVGTAGLVAVAVAAIALLTLINILGAIPGKRTQNWLTVAKVAGLAALVIAGFSLAGGRTEPARPLATSGTFWVAMLMILYTYDGWNEATYIAGEVQNWRRTVPIALVLGASAVTAIYLLVNCAILMGLGFDGARAVQYPTIEVVSLALGDYGAVALSILVIVSALGGANGTILAGSRLYAELGADHRIFKSLGRWSQRWQSPVGALLVQGAISIGTVLVIAALGYGQMGFKVIVDATAPVFWLFFMLTGLSLLVLRIKEPHVERPFRVPGFPITPLIFIGWCTYMLVGSAQYAWTQGPTSLMGLGVLLLGVPLYFVSRTLRPSTQRAPAAKTVAAVEDEPVPQRCAG